MRKTLLIPANAGTQTFSPNRGAKGSSLGPRIRGDGRLWGVALALLATPALAHEGHHEQMPMMQALRHLVSEPDHQIAFAALVVLAVIAGWSWRRAKARK